VPDGDEDRRTEGIGRTGGRDDVDLVLLVMQNGRVGDEAPGAGGAGEPPLGPAAERQAAEHPLGLHVRGRHPAAAVGAAPGRLLHPEHLLLLAAQHRRRAGRQRRRPSRRSHPRHQSRPHFALALSLSLCVQVGHQLAS